MPLRNFLQLGTFGRASPAFAARVLQLCLSEKTTEDVIARGAEGDVIKDLFSHLAWLLGRMFKNAILRAPQTTGIGKILRKVLLAQHKEGLVG